MFLLGLQWEKHWQRGGLYPKHVWFFHESLNILQQYYEVPKIWAEAAKWYQKESHICELICTSCPPFSIPHWHLKRTSCNEDRRDGDMTKFLYYFFHHLILKQESLRYWSCQGEICPSIPFFIVGWCPACITPSLLSITISCSVLRKRFLSVAFISLTNLVLCDTPSNPLCL